MSPAPGAFERGYFDESYRNYVGQNPERKLRFYRGLVERAAGERPRPRLLEVGCAFGRFLGSLDPRFEPSGLDPSAYAIDEARRALQGVPLAVGSLPELPFPGPFDVVAAFDVLEHVEDLDAARRALAERMAPDGALVFVVPVYDGPTGPLIRWLDRDPTHVHKRSRDFWLEWAAAAFAVEEWWGITRYYLPVGYYLHWPTRRLRRVTPAIAVVARRAWRPVPEVV